MSEKKPAFKCRRLHSVSLDADAEPDLVDWLRQAMQDDTLQFYHVERFEPAQEVTAVYDPVKHVLALFYDGAHVFARDIPSMYLGLKWWHFEPDVWKQHVAQQKESE